MIKQAGDTYVTFCTLVNHPRGHDDGEFAQDHDYYLNKDGSVEYHVNRPYAPQNDFDGEDLQRYSEADNRDDAITKLRDRLELAQRAVVVTAEALRRLEAGGEYLVTLDQESED